MLRAAGLLALLAAPAMLSAASPTNTPSPSSSFTRSPTPSPVPLSGTRTASAATFYIIADDSYDVYVNGHLLPDAPCETDPPFYCQSASNVLSVPIPLSWLDCSGTNLIASTVYDSGAGSRIWAAYLLLIQYSDSSYDEIISDGSNTEYWYDGAGSYSYAPAISGSQWYEPAYVPGGGWSPATQVGGVCGGASISYSLGSVPKLSWNSVCSAAIAPAAAYSFRQTFVLYPCVPATATPTLSPSFTPGGASPTPTPTPSTTATQSATPTASPTATPNVFASLSATLSPTPSQAATALYDDPPGGGGLELDADHATCYPNPARGGHVHFAFKMPGPGRSRIRVFAADGSQAASFSQEHATGGMRSVDCDISAFAPGVYFFIVDREAPGRRTDKTPLEKFLVTR